jgi:Protein of unknown function (DUF3306)
MAENRRSEEEQSFLGRWSRRKRESARVDAEPEAPLPETTEGEGDRQKEALERAAIEKGNREAAEAVDLDGLTYESDYSIFFRAGVPAALKRMAMRKLWTSNPVLANLDGLNDYDEDFNNPAHNVFRSVWQVGRGYLTDMDTGQSPPAAENKTVDVEAKEPNSAAQTPRGELIDVSADDARGETEVRQTEIAEDAMPETTEERPVKRVSIRQRLKG